MLVARAKFVICILFYLNKISQTEWNLIRPFCDDKHFTAAAHLGLKVKLIESIGRYYALLFLIPKLEQ